MHIGFMLMKVQNALKPLSTLIERLKESGFRLTLRKVFSIYGKYLDFFSKSLSSTPLLVPDCLTGKKSHLTQPTALTRSRRSFQSSAKDRN